MKINIKHFNKLIFSLFYKIKYEDRCFNFLPFKKILIDNKKYNKNKININIPENRDYINEYKMKEIIKKMYFGIHKSFNSNHNFFSKDYISPELCYILNETSKRQNILGLINISNIEILEKYNSYGFVHSNNKLFGLYNKHEIIHEISAGILGPEISKIWDQKPIKQNLLVSIKSDVYNDLIHLERDLMLNESEWIISDINYIKKRI
jgi:hypothetical protein